ncbi:hypothetical protein FGF1_19960 [Flavobacteriaceae bacterium GF1]
MDKKNQEKKKQINNVNRETISLSLPDSLNIGDLLEGHIEFKRTANPIPNEDVFKKYTFLYLTISKDEIDTFKELMEVPHDTFAPIDESIIPIYNLKAQEKGSMLLQGFLVNQFLYKKGNDSVRIVNKDRKITHRINVY